ncbi:uncharacterized protein LOC143247444 [Tachypleus tridentatus]|uniref:uncharacterized protein LOC143247444 n=1 Tax=Tachypleus tridentatus TaxID=6853 RepID=UPI003FD65CE3
MLPSSHKLPSTPRSSVPPVILHGLPLDFSPHQIIAFIDEFKPSISVDPRKTRILCQGGILLQPSTIQDHAYLCKPWNVNINIQCSPIKSFSSLYSVFIKNIHLSTTPSEIQHSLETTTSSKLHAARRIHPKTTGLPTHFVKVVTQHKQKIRANKPAV